MPTALGHFIQTHADAYQTSLALFASELRLLKRVLWKTKNQHGSARWYQKLTECSRHLTLLGRSLDQDGDTENVLASSDGTMARLDKCLGIILSTYCHLEAAISMSILAELAVTALCIISRFHSLSLYFRHYLCSLQTILNAHPALMTPARHDPVTKHTKPGTAPRMDEIDRIFMELEAA